MTSETHDPRAIADTVIAAFGTTDSRPTETDVERVMRPFGIISTATQHRIDMLLHEAGAWKLGLWIGSWIEANVVVSGEPDDRAGRLEFLLRDTCTCVLAHLPEAIRHASGDVDERVLRLIQSENTRVDGTDVPA